MGWELIAVALLVIIVLGTCVVAWRWGDELVDLYFGSDASEDDDTTENGNGDDFDNWPWKGPGL